MNRVVNMARNAGKLFEEDIKKSIPQNVYFERFKDIANAWNNNDNENIRFTPKQPYDCFMFVTPKFFALECKSTNSTSFSFKGASPKIKQHQIDELLKASLYSNVVAGFIFNFRNENNDTYFLDITNFLVFCQMNDKSSINLNDIIKYGGTKIENEILRTRYRYHIEKFINEKLGE